MNKVDNLELRSEILEVALNLESSINDLIVSSLNIEHPNPKAISNKSNSLSFKNKLDLLYDLEILSKVEYSNLLLIMEFRNQFLHNIECNSFVKAVELLGNDKGKQLLKFDKLNFEAKQEYKFNQAFKELFIICSYDILDKYKKRIEKHKEKFGLFESIFDYSNYLLDANDKKTKEIMMICLPEVEDDSKILFLKSKVLSIIAEDGGNLQSSEKYMQLRNRLESFDQMKISRLLK